MFLKNSSQTLHKYYNGFIQILKIQVNYRTSPENKGNENETSFARERPLFWKGLPLVFYLSHAEYLLTDAYCGQESW